MKPCPPDLPVGMEGEFTPLDAFGHPKDPIRGIILSLTCSETTTYALIRTETEVLAVRLR